MSKVDAWDGCEELITDHNYVSENEYCKDVIIGASENERKAKDIQTVRDKLLRLYADNDVKQYVDPENFMDIIMWLTRSEVGLEAALDPKGH